MAIILWIAWVLFAGLYICGPIMDPDLWWHLTVGKWILGHQAIPATEQWNMFAIGEPWKAYSWSNEVLFAFFDKYWGMEGLLVIKILLAIFIAFSMFYCFGRMARDWFVGGALGLYTTVACFSHFQLRPQSFVWIYFVWILYLSFQVQEEGFSRKKGLGLFFIMMLWANTHITTVLGIGSVVGWLLIIQVSENHKIERIFFRSGTLKAVLCALAGTFITPYMGGEWLTFFSKTGHPFSYSAIAEFQPANIMNYSTAFLIVSSVLMFLFLHLRPRVIAVSKLLLWAAFAVAALAVIKFLPMAVIITAALVALIWRREEKDRAVLGNINEAIEKVRDGYEWLPKEGFAFLILCMGFISIWPEWTQVVNDDYTPVASVDFIEENKLPHPVLNEFGRGGYLMYRFSDENGVLEHKVALDGRTNVNPPEVFEKFTASLQGLYNWRDYIELVNPGTILWRNESPFDSLLELSPEWIRVFTEGTAAQGYSVFVKMETVESLGLEVVKAVIPESEDVSSGLYPQQMKVPALENE